MQGEIQYYYRYPRRNETSTWRLDTLNVSVAYSWLETGDTTQPGRQLVVLLRLCYELAARSCNHWSMWLVQPIQRVIFLLAICFVDLDFVEIWFPRIYFVLCKNGWWGRGSLLLYVCRILNQQRCISPSQSQHRLVLCSAIWCFTNAEYHSGFRVLQFFDTMTGFGLRELLWAMFSVATKPISCSLVLQDTSK